MANIQIHARGFTGVYLTVNGNSRENMSTLDIVRATVTLGASNPLDLIRYGWRRFGASLCQGIMTSLLLESHNGELVVSPAFNSLVKSEKATTTYWLGMAFTKLTAEKKLMVPWLSHVDRLWVSGVLTLTAGTQERGDLAGMDRNRKWHVLEAKGRSYNVESGLIEQAKSQASRITAINGVRPSTASACIVQLFATPISVELVDPKSDNPNSETSWEINESEFYRIYYKSVMEHLKRHDTKRVQLFDLDFDVALTGVFGQKLWIGLLKMIREKPDSAP